VVLINVYTGVDRGGGDAKLKKSGKERGEDEGKAGQLTHGENAEEEGSSE